MAYSYVCKECGNKFASVNKGQSFCSKKCCDTFKKGRPVPSRRKRVSCACVICGNIYERTASNPGKFCSKGCWSVRNPPKEYKCAGCDVVFIARSSSNPRYCSRGCYARHKRVICTGPNSHRWKGGKTKINQILRGRADYDDWRETVFTRDCFTCQQCGARSQKGKSVYLHAHHIKGWADYPDLRYEVSNGMTLCVPCHRKKHGHVF